ncbi:MAG TPA: hypothetical protein VGF01_22075 [Terracidiphilus sp.]
MSTQKALAFAGNTSSPFAESLQRHFSLATVSNGADIDLAVDGPSAQISGSTMEAALKAGRSVVISEPTAEQLKTLISITGEGPSSEVLAISYRKRAKGGYDCRFVPTGTTQFKSIANDGAIVEGAPQSYKMSPSAALLTSSPTDFSTGGYISGFIPPAGTQAGYSAFSGLNSWQVGYPTVNNSYDDNTMTSGTQNLQNYVMGEFYVYWVNGLTASPYFIVILRVTGVMDIGSVAANNSNSRGWFNTNFYVQTGEPQQNNEPVNGLTLLTAQPQNNVYSQAPINVGIAMSLYGNGATGPGPQNFDAQYQTTTTYTGWSVANERSGLSTNWQMYETDVWNVVSNPVNDFGSWWQLVYNDNTDPQSGNPSLPEDAVVNLPGTSLGSISYETITAWQISAPAFTPPSPSQNSSAPPCEVNFSGSVIQWLSFLHNPEGCHGNDGRHHHLFAAGVSQGWGWNMDLGAIANLQNLAGA